MRGPKVGRAGRSDEGGVVAILVALSFAVLMSLVAIVVDLGAAREQKGQARAAADAAALAGVLQLQLPSTTCGMKETPPPPSPVQQAQECAKRYAGADGFSNSNNNGNVIVNIPPLSGSHVDGLTCVEVLVTKSIAGQFSPMIGISSTSVGARAVACPTPSGDALVE
jgi:hypothetical protein